MKNRKNKNNVIMSVVILVAILLLAVAVSAALTQGFTNANPYGWLDKKLQTGTLERGDKINAVILQEVDIDLEKVVEDLYAEDENYTGTIAFGSNKELTEDFSVYVDAGENVYYLALRFGNDDDGFAFYVYVTEATEFNGEEVSAGWSKVIETDDELVVEHIASGTKIELGDIFIIDHVADYELFNQLFVPVKAK